MNHGKEKQHLSFLSSEDNTNLFAAPNACSDALSSSAAIAKDNSNTRVDTGSLLYHVLLSN
jgi:hypothetical protein